jgi:hypothetical protein
VAQNQWIWWLCHGDVVAQNQWIWLLSHGDVVAQLFGCGGSVQGIRWLSDWDGWRLSLGGKGVSVALLSARHFRLEVLTNISGCDASISEKNKTFKIYKNIFSK